MKNTPLFLPVLLSTSLITGCAWLPWHQQPASQSAFGAQSPRIVPHARIQDGGDSAAAFHALGRHLQREGRLDDAERAYRRALDFDPAHTEARNALAVIAASRGDIAQAITMLSTLAHAHPDQPHLLANLGHAHYLKGDYVQAKDWLSRALALAPDNDAVRRKLALVREKLGEPQDTEAVTEVVAVPPLPRPAEANALPRNPVQKVSEGVYQLIRPLAADVASAPQPMRCELPRIAEMSPSPAGEHVVTPVAGPATERPATVVPAATAATQTSVTTPVASAGQDAAPAGGKLRIELANGNGIPRLARSLRDLITGSQWQVIRVINHEEFSVTTTRIEYAKHRYAAARELSEALGITAQLRPNYQQGDTQLRVILGHDFRTTERLRERLANTDTVVLASRD